MPECERKTRHDYEHRSHCKGVLKVHLIFVTRFRKPCLTGDLARNCKEILTDIAEHHGWIIQKIETDKDHVHMLLQYPPTDCISGIVQCMKQQSTLKCGSFTKQNYAICIGIKTLSGAKGTSTAA